MAMQISTGAITLNSTANMDILDDNIRAATFPAAADSPRRAVYKTRGGEEHSPVEPIQQRWLPPTITTPAMAMKEPSAICAHHSSSPPRRVLCALCLGLLLASGGVLAEPAANPGPDGAGSDRAEPAATAPPGPPEVDTSTGAADESVRAGGLEVVDEIVED